MIKWWVLFLPVWMFSQKAFHTGTVSVPFSIISYYPASGTPLSVLADSNGVFMASLTPQNYLVKINAPGYATKTLSIQPPFQDLIAELMPEGADLGNIVVTGAMREQSKDESAINIDIITSAMFKKTAMPNVFDAVGLINGVKPQINCNVCSTGDIHINGMEGPYTLILIDGMPIVSGLSTVYGLMGIPQGMIERLEIAKGPASALYGSESMAGTINLITKDAFNAPKLFVEHFTSGFLENNTSFSLKSKINKKWSNLLGINTFYFDNIVDNNNDGFTDLTLQKRISIFNKLQKDGLSIAARFVYENRWGGQTNWNNLFRGSDSIYGESIYTNRLEFIGKYDWKKIKGLKSQWSYNLHDQDAYYGITKFIARQSTAFLQTFINHEYLKHSLLYGMAIKHTWYNDNTIVTPFPENTLIPGLFFQDEFRPDSALKHTILSGLRMDYHPTYKLIPSPRVAWKYSPNFKLTMRTNIATGFRVVNVFTEDHAALTGSREVVFLEAIKPERSLNGSFNLTWKMKVNKSNMLIWDATFFYYHFFNRINANYDLNPNWVVYQNLKGYGYSRGLSINLNYVTIGPLKMQSGFTLSDVQNVQKDSVTLKSRQVHAPLWSGNYQISYEFKKMELLFDLVGTWFGRQRLPIQPNDYRPEYSNPYTLLDLQVTKSIKRNFEFALGVKNILNFVPKYPLMRPFDPFDKRIADTVNNPNGYTFDTSYNYAPLQGRRLVFTIRYLIK